MKFALLIGVSFLLYILIVYVAISVENFGVFGCSPILFDKALKDTKTPQELDNYLKTEWNPKTTDEKNNMMTGWEKMPCNKQTELYDMLVKMRQKRDTVDALANN